MAKGASIFETSSAIRSLESNSNDFGFWSCTPLVVDSDARKAASLAEKKAKSLF